VCSPVSFFCCLESCFLCEFSGGLGVLFLEAGSVAGLDGLLGFGGAFVDGGDLGSVEFADDAFSASDV